ncbi:MAG TPA: DNA polymerase IV [Syntrophales bacterium]|nr:DNA polymerase IV [Syntrophales bacterium]
MRTILHLDMDAFFAAVEQKRRPELAGKPVVIGGDGDPARRGVVSTASYEARRFGIHSAMPLRKAWKLCPEAVFLPVDYPEYARISAIMKCALGEFGLPMEDVGIDEAFLDLSAAREDPARLAGEIKRKVFAGTGLTCSIGIGPNKLIAKIASDMQKPDGLTVLREEDVPLRVHVLPVRKLLGVGPKTEQALAALGIRTIGELAAADPEFLVSRFGSSFGTYLHKASLGIDDSPIITHWEPKSVSRETTFQTDLGKWQDIARSLAELAREVSADLRRSGYLARNVGVKVRFSDFETVTRASTLEKPVCSEEEIRKGAFACLKRIDLAKRVRLIGVRAAKLEKIVRSEE